MKRALLPLLLSLLLLLGGCGRQAPAPKPAPTPLPAPTAAPASGWPELPVYVEGLLRLRGYDCEGTLYLGAEDVCALFGLRGEATADERGGRLTLDAWVLEPSSVRDVYTADGRYLYCPEGCRVLGGRVCFPAAMMERLFGLRITREADRAVIDTSRFQLLRGGEDYYLTRFHADDLFWLSHIIYSESHWEPLAGEIGVGNVVLNRVKSDAFPSTVMAVVLDRENRIQFSPVETGEVLAEPDEEATIAACLCLEGYNTVGESLFFVNPDRGDDTWFQEALTPTVTIGNHHFYA